MVPIRLLATLLVLQLSYARKSSELVIGGHPCNINEHPFLVLVYRGKHLCGGTLINKEWVLTAAHCNGKIMKIVLGVHSKKAQNKNKQTRVPKEKFFCTSDRNYTLWDKDIMLIRLNRPVTYRRHIKPLRLPSSPAIVGSVCHVMGWGSISTTNVTLPDVPHCANVDLLHYSACRAAYSGLPPKGRVLCAGVLKGGRDTCQGDSGGPLICNGKFQGLLSWGSTPCAKLLEPALYTNVFDYTDWIQSIMAGNTTATCPP